MLKLTEELRKILAEPQGKLYEGEGVEPIKRAVSEFDFAILACVGDIVTYYTIKSQFKPDIIVIDGKSIRRSLDDAIVTEIDEATSDYESIKAENPAGHITEDLVEKIFQAIELVKSGCKVRIFVNGEEDLAVMPLAIMLPKGSLIVYGQPKRGVVAIAVNREKKIEIFGLVRRMKTLGGETLDKLRRWSDGDIG